MMSEIKRDILGSIENERLWLRGARTRDEVRMHIDNISLLRENLRSLESEAKRENFRSLKSLEGSQGGET